MLFYIVYAYFCVMYINKPLYLLISVYISHILKNDQQLYILSYLISISIFSIISSSVLCRVALFCFVDNNKL